MFSLVLCLGSQHQIRTHDDWRSCSKVGGVPQPKGFRNVLCTLIREQRESLADVSDSCGKFSYQVAVVFEVG